MRAKSDAMQNCPPGIKITTPWRVLTVSALPQFRIKVTFIDGLQGYVDLSLKIQSDQAGVFAKLRDQSLFNQVYVEYGVATWPGALDLAPDAMYENIKQKGEWVLT